jgi:hypothetical protein
MAKPEQSVGVQSLKPTFAYHPVRPAETVSAHDFLGLFVPGEEMLVLFVEAIQVERPAGALPSRAESGLPQTSDFGQAFRNLMSLREEHREMVAFLHTPFRRKSSDLRREYG